MTKILDWKRAEDPRDVIHLAVQALAEGHLVAFPAGSTYVIAASSLRASGIQAMQSIVDDFVLDSVPANEKYGPSPVAIAPRSANELNDYSPRITPMAKHIASKLWPGLVQIMLDTSHPGSIVHCLPDLAKFMIGDERGFSGFVVPDHESFTSVVEFSVGPILVVNPSHLARRSTQTDLASIIDSRVALAIDDGVPRSVSPWPAIRIVGDRCCVERQSIMSAEDLVTRSQFKILLVCTGNTCRSPMAQVLFEQKLRQRFPEHFANRQLAPVQVSSAGVSAHPGEPASDGAIAAMESLGLDLSRHESQPTTEALVDEADLILTMTNSHRQALLGRWPHLTPKVFGVAPEHGDVTDPYGGSVEVYEACAAKLDRYLEAWLDKLDRDKLPIWSIAGKNGCV